MELSTSPEPPSGPPVLGPAEVVGLLVQALTAGGLGGDVAFRGEKFLSLREGTGQVTISGLDVRTTLLA